VTRALVSVCRTAWLASAVCSVLVSTVAASGSSHGTAAADLVGNLHSPNVTARVAAAERLGEMGEEAVSAVPALVALLGDQTVVDDTGWRMGEEAARTLGKIGGPGVDALLKALSYKEAPFQRSAAVQGLAYSDEQRATAALHAALRDPVDTIRGHAALSLALRGDTAAVSDLLSLLKSDNSSQVRMDAAMALGLIKARPAVNGLIAGLEDQDASVREFSAVALAVIHDPHAVPSLIPLLQDEATNVRLAVAQSLGSFTDDPRVLEPLVSALRDQKTSRMAATSLARSRNPRLVPRMIELLKDPSPSVRERAAWVLGFKHKRAVVKALRAALQDRDVGVRQAAANALDEVQSARAVEPGGSLLGFVAALAAALLLWAHGVARLTRRGKRASEAQKRHPVVMAIPALADLIVGAGVLVVGVAFLWPGIPG